MTDDWFKSIVHVTWFISEHCNPFGTDPHVWFIIQVINIRKSTGSASPGMFVLFFDGNKNNRNDGLRIFFPPFFLIQSNFNNLTTAFVFFKVGGRGNGTGTRYPPKNNVKTVSHRWCCFVCTSIYSNAIWDYKSSLSNRDYIDI